MSIIEASCAGFKDLADGTVRFFFDVEPRHAGDALALFRVRGTAAALAALKPCVPDVPEPPSRESVPEPSPIGPICKWLVMRCKEPEFQRWLVGGTGIAAEADSIQKIRELCAVTSRKEIDGNADAEKRFQSFVRGPWLKYQLARGKQMATT